MSLTEAPSRVAKNAGTVLLQSGLAEQALPYLLELQKKEPERWEHFVNLGIAYRMLGDWPNSSACYTQAIRLAPDQPALWYNVAVLCEDFGHFKDALDTIEPLHSAYPYNQQFALLFAHAMLRTGNWKEAWSAWEIGRFGHSWSPIPNLMVWKGEPLEGKRLLVFCEGGFGDTFLFQRYFRLLKEKGASVHFCVWDKQIGVLEGHPYVDGFVKNSEGADPSEYDFQTPLLSLPRVFSEGPANVPANEFVPKGSGKDFGIHKNGVLNIGLCWSAEENGVTRKVRSIEETKLGLLWREGTQFHSLQPTADGPEWVRKYALSDWRDTVSLIEKMDVVVSVDTAVAHLACMMGKRTLILLPPSSDWKWGVLPANPWWPTAELFRTLPTETFEDSVKRVAEKI